MSDVCDRADGCAAVARLRGELGAADRLIARLRMKRNRRDYAAIIDRLVQRGVIERADAAGAKSKTMESHG